MNMNTTREYLSSSSEDLSSPDFSTMDNAARKRFKKLYLLTNELVHHRDEKIRVYQSKLYRKYRELKKLNRQLQEKILSQHCPGCHCFAYRLDQTSSVVHSTTRSFNQENISPEISDESSDEEENNNDNKIENNENGFSKLPKRLQETILAYVAKHRHRERLLNLGRCPKICEYICDESILKIDENELKQLAPLYTFNENGFHRFAASKINMIKVDLRAIRKKYLENIV